MRRLFVLLALALAPLLASAHGGHHSAAPEIRPPAAAKANGTVRAVVSAPSRCPGGEENCCCHGAACTPSFQPVAIDARPTEVGTALACAGPAFYQAIDALRAVVFARHSPRGPPTRS